MAVCFGGVGVLAIVAIVAWLQRQFVLGGVSGVGGVGGVGVVAFTAIFAVAVCSSF